MPIEGWPINRCTYLGNVDSHLTGIGGDQTKQNGKQRGFSCAVAPQQGVDFPRANITGNIVQNMLAVEAFRDFIDSNSCTHGC